MTTWTGPETPSGTGRAEDRAVPDGTSRQDFLARWKAAEAARNAALRRGARRPRRGRHRAGMTRRVPLATAEKAGSSDE